ncbi:MAG TPA: hypothetical protein PLY88_07735 [Candidatus Omnitrophota bacterium]|nr:hypothetical protein [Candidatus Omnitrophota bacterium]
MPDIDFEKALGLADGHNSSRSQDKKTYQLINQKLAALGCPVFRDELGTIKLREKTHRGLAPTELCPVDERVQKFLHDYLKDVCGNQPPKLPHHTLVLDRHGIARALSLPPDQDSFTSDVIQSYRIQQGVLHNPANDRRTTQGVFHVTEGGLPIPDDKKAVPKKTFAALLEAAIKSPKKLMQLPFTSSQKDQAEAFVSLLLRPIICPEIPGYIPQKSMEIRFVAPGNLVSNLDFVESIFGNAGDPYLPENNSALDVEHWSGHTGYVLLAPHLTKLTKKELGLPHFDNATERQKRDGMCWKKSEELYNDGSAFKVTCRDERGVIVTVIADNYFGYCKKEVKTQISYAANLFGIAEEEHAGGALAFAGYDLGDQFDLSPALVRNPTTFDEMSQIFSSIMDLQPDGYGIDKKHKDIIYVPENSRFNMHLQTVSWEKNDKIHSIHLKAFHYYILPSGYKITLRKRIDGKTWYLIGIAPEGTLCHKPCTVSGGGKSEISKSIMDAVVPSSFYTHNLPKDLDTVEEIMRHDFTKRYREASKNKPKSRPILSPDRSLGSVIKLLSPSPEYTDEYNAWLNSIFPTIKDLIYLIKCYYREDWGQDWRKHFTVDIMNGYLGHELKLDDRKVVSSYLRVGYEPDGTRRVFRVRQDFTAAQKLQVEDDITASALVPASSIKYLNPEYKNPSVKVVTNCEYRLFQRPDDAIIRGYDKQAELDLSSPNTFLSNYEPLTKKGVHEVIEDAMGYDSYTDSVKNMLNEFAKNDQPEYASAPSHPRIVDGKPTKNPRYLQTRLDVTNPKVKYLCELGTRIARKVPPVQPVTFTVNAILAGRRNNPPEPKHGIKPLAVYNPIHYQELPELFMDFISSVTGKSPSTTGFGSEGALTKGPFNALFPSADLNNAFLSFILGDYAGFSSAAGYVGPQYRVEHDISLLVPEIWCRLTAAERDPAYLIREGHLEPVQDFDHNGKKIPASILGYRITYKFVNYFLGRIFNNPNFVFPEAMLRPETQSMDIFVEGIDNLMQTHEQVARHYLNDGSVETLVPPLKALIHIMAHGNYNGMDRHSPEFRKMFSREAVIQSDWYQSRLKKKQNWDLWLWQRHEETLLKYSAECQDPQSLKRLKIEAKLKQVRAEIKRISSNAYLKELTGTIGSDIMFQVPNAKAHHAAGNQEKLAVVR